MKLSRTSYYAVRAIIALAQDSTGQPVACRSIALEREMPKRFLLQILRNLVTHGLLISVRGVDGGYKLGRPAQEITLLNLVEAIEGPLASCVPTDGTLAEPIQAKLRKICEDIAAATRSRLAGTTLHDLMQGTTPAIPAASVVPSNVSPIRGPFLNESFFSP